MAAATIFAGPTCPIGFTRGHRLWHGAVEATGTTCRLPPAAATYHTIASCPPGGTQGTRHQAPGTANGETRDCLDSPPGAVRAPVDGTAQMMPFGPQFSPSCPLHCPAPPPGLTGRKIAALEGQFRAPAPRWQHPDSGRGCRWGPAARVGGGLASQSRWGPGGGGGAKPSLEELCRLAGGLTGCH